jgi:hypothetical protein
MTNRENPEQWSGVLNDDRYDSDFPPHQSPLYKHADLELTRVGLGPDESGDKLQIRKHLLNLIEIIANEGHSGFSALWTAGVLDRLIQFKPLSDLTFDDDQWTETEPGVFQHKRDPAVWSNDDKRTYFNFDGEYANGQPMKALTGR